MISFSVSEVFVNQPRANHGTSRVLAALHLPDEEKLPGAVMEYLARNAELETIRLSCLKETSARIAHEIEQDGSIKAILATHDAAIGGIWTNRHSGVRSVVVYSFEQAKRDIIATNANVIIVDPRDVGSYAFRRIVDFFVQERREGR